MKESKEKPSRYWDTMQSMVTQITAYLPSLKWLRRAAVAVVGFSVLLVGIAMIVLPGPAFIVIPLGLAILATEFVWAAKLLKKAKEFFKRKGVCPECGKKIEKARLATDPPATMCLACEQKTGDKAAPASVPAISE
jgi:tellurite resistance protein TerC